MNKVNKINNPLSDEVSHQYEKWVYPEPILDLPAWLENNWQWFDPSHASRMLWPNQDYKPDLDILIAGCGTNQAAVYAYTNPEAKVVAMDVSQSSLDHHQFLKEKYGLKNLELHLLPIEEVNVLNRDFDLIVSTGVLHHLANPQLGLNALAKCLRQDGVMALMLYAKYGRIGVEILQSVFHDLGLSQESTPVHIIRDALEILPQDHPVRSYLAIAPDLKFDAGVVDTFLHIREQSYSINECIELVSAAGLVFQDLFLKSPYYPPHSALGEFYSNVRTLPESQQWSIMERINFRNACHFFTACREDRPKEKYKIDFTSEEIFNLVPSLRYRCSLEGSKLSRPNWSLTLNPQEIEIIQRVDGLLSVTEILKQASNSPVIKGQNQTDLRMFGKALFQKLWQLDFLSMGLKP